MASFYPIFYYVFVSPVDPFSLTPHVIAVYLHLDAPFLPAVLGQSHDVQLHPLYIGLHGLLWHPGHLTSESGC